MGLLVEFDLVKDFEFTTETPTLGIPIYYDDGMGEFETVFMDTIDDLCPVDTGFLHDSIQVEIGDTSIKAWTDCEYAQYVEYGTWKQDAQPYFVPALEEALNAALPFWREAMEEALQEEAEELEAQAEEDADYVAEQGGPTPVAEGFGPMAGSISAWAGMVLALTVISFIKEMFNFDDVRDYSRGDRETNGFGLRSKGIHAFSARIFMPTITIT